MFKRGKTQLTSDFITDREQVLEWQELVTHSDDTIKKVVEILDYTEQEKEEIDKLMEIVHKIDDLIKSWKSIANTMNYHEFVFSYKNLDDRLKKHFVDIYKELIIEVWKFKINRIINSKPMPSWFDESWIKAEVINILSVDPNYDFSIFWNDLVNKIAKDWKYVTKKYWISF